MKTIMKTYKKRLCAALVFVTVLAFSAAAFTGCAGNDKGKNEYSSAPISVGETVSSSEPKVWEEDETSDAAESYAQSISARHDSVNVSEEVSISHGASESCEDSYSSYETSYEESTSSANESTSYEESTSSANEATSYEESASSANETTSSGKQYGIPSNGGYFPAN